MGICDILGGAADRPTDRPTDYLRSYHGLQGRQYTRLYYSVFRIDRNGFFELSSLKLKPMAMDCMASILPIIYTKQSYIGLGHYHTHTSVLGGFVRARARDQRAT